MRRFVLGLAWVAAIGSVCAIASSASGCARPARPRDDGSPAGPRARASGSTEGSSEGGIDAVRPPDAAPEAAPDAATELDAAADAPLPSIAPPIVDAPMAWSAERERLTLEYRRRHSEPAAADLAIEPRVIVLHYTGGGSAKATRRYFDQVRLEAARKELRAGGAVNVSAHFVVDRDGTIYQLQPTTRFARHCIGLNQVAIGIENVGDDAKHPLTEAQVAADAALIRELARRHPITHLLGHHEVMAFRDHPYYVEREPGYHNRKPDPGPDFMARVRARLTDLELRGR